MSLLLPDSQSSYRSAGVKIPSQVHQTLQQVLIIYLLLRIHRYISFKIVLKLLNDHTFLKLIETSVITLTTILNKGVLSIAIGLLMVIRTRFIEKIHTKMSAFLGCKI